MKELFVDKSVFLHNLFEGDSGKTSPNSAVSVQIRKYGGTNFSAAVRQYGFPFKASFFLVILALIFNIYFFSGYSKSVV